MATDNISIVKRLIDEVWTKGRFEVADELVAKTCVTYDPLAGELRGVDAFKQFAKSMRTAFPDFQLDVDDIITANDEVYLRWTAKGTHRGNLVGMSPSNKRAVIGGMTVNRIQGGKIVETRHTWDTLNLLQQLGYLPTMDKIATSSPTIPRH